MYMNSCMVCGHLQDEFWKYVAQATKEDKITNPDAWAQVAKNLTFSFLMDDGISVLLESHSVCSAVMPKFSTCPSSRMS